MVGALRNLVLRELWPDGIWQLTEPTRSILTRQISRLPRRTVSEIDARYPTTPASMRAFLEAFFTRHYFQIQNSLISYMTSQDFLKLLSSGHSHILDIGSGPAVASLATTDMLAYIVKGLRTIGDWPGSKTVEVTYVLNDTSRICLAVGQRMLTDYFQRKRAYGTAVIRGRTFTVQRPFPHNMDQIGRIARNVGTYDIAILSYVLGPLIEDNGLSALVNGLFSVEQLCTHDGRILIVQDKFKGALMRRVSAALGTSTRREELTQEIYPDREIGKTNTYSYYNCLYEPTKETGVTQGFVA